MNRSHLRFPETRWTILLALNDQQQRELALEELCRAYWTPICGFLRRSFAVPEAEDLTQEFLLMVLRNGLFERANRGEGRLRSWLLRALGLFVANHQRVTHAQKRGSGATPLPLESTAVHEVLERLETEPAMVAAFDREWAEGMVQMALAALRRHYEAAQRGAVFESLLPWLLAEGDSHSQSASAASCGLTLTNYRVQLHRLRGRYRDELRRHIAATTSDEAEVEEELRHLLAALQAV